MALRYSDIKVFVCCLFITSLAVLPGATDAGKTCDGSVSSFEESDGSQICTKKGYCNKPFVETPDSSPTISLDTIKTYTTTLTLTSIFNDTEWNITIIDSAINDFYSNNQTVRGFISSQILRNDTNSESQDLLIRYEVLYNYTLLNASATNASSDSDADGFIRHTLGNITYISEGLLQNPDFASVYNISETFDFTGNCLCDIASSICVGFQDFDCTAATNGVSVTCVTSDPYCYNEGYCFKRENQECVCSCLNSLNYWFVGDRCETWFHIWMVIVFFVVVGLLLFLVIPLVTLCFVRTVDERLLKEKEKEEKKKLKAAAKEREHLKTIKEENENDNQNVTNGNATLGNNDTDVKTVPVAAPRQNTTPLNRTINTSADSFDDTESDLTNLSNNRSRSTQKKSDMNPNTELKNEIDVEEQIVDPYATFNTATTPQDPESSSNSSSSSDGSTAVHGFQSGGIYLPPIPYNDPPKYISLETLQKTKEKPMVTTV